MLSRLILLLKTTSTRKTSKMDQVNQASDVASTQIGDCNISVTSKLRLCIVAVIDAWNNEECSAEQMDKVLNELHKTGQDISEQYNSLAYETVVLNQTKRDLTVQVTDERIAKDYYSEERHRLTQEIINDRITIDRIYKDFNELEGRFYAERRARNNLQRELTNAYGVVNHNEEILKKIVDLYSYHTDPANEEIFASPTYLKAMKDILYPVTGHPVAGPNGEYNDPGAKITNDALMNVSK